MTDATQQPDALNSETIARELTRWKFINQWQVEVQSNDRKPMNSATVSESSAPAVQRSQARRSHQLKFKQWSKERHD
jgi:hypothetical protein